MEGVNKVFAPLYHKPLLAWAVEAFQACPSVDEAVLVLAEENLEQGRRLTREYGWSKVAALCRGGNRRQDSVLEGMKQLPDCHWVVIHDGARPLVCVDLVEKGLDEAQESGAAVAAVPVKDTIKLVSQDSFVQETPDRQALWSVQTPQVFRFDLLVQAHQQAQGEVSDDATLVEQLGQRVRVYMGSYDNIKVTTPEDLALAEILLRNRKASP